MSWTEKYRPRTFEEVAGNKKAIGEIKKWIDEWKAGNPQPPLLLVGPPGTGKTTLAHIIGRKFSDTLELNASDKRSQDAIRRTAGEASSTYSLFNHDLKLIILDEVDGIHGNEDRGGVQAINRIIKESRHPLVLTANDPYSKRLQTIKPKCKVINIRKVHTASIAAALKRICRAEGIDCPPDVLKELAKRSMGDLRSAINDLEAMAKGEESVGKELLDTGAKDAVSTIFDAVRAVLKSRNVVKVREAMRVDDDPTSVLEFIAENVPREYEKPHEISRAYDMLSRADVFFGRAVRSRDYTYWRYASELMGPGVALSKEETYRKFVRYSGSSSFRILGRTRKKRALRDSVARKMAGKMHISPKVAISMFPFLEIIFENYEMAYEIKEYLELTDEEVKLFRKKKIRAPEKKKPRKKTETPREPLPGPEKRDNEAGADKGSSRKSPEDGSERNRSHGQGENENKKNDEKPKEKQTSLFQFK